MSHDQGRRVVALVSGSHFVNHAYLVVLAPLVGVLASEFGVGIGAIGLAIGVQNAVVLSLQLPFGYVSDTRSRTLVLAISLVVGTAGVAATALAPSYEWLLAAQVLLGVGIAGHHPAHYPLLAVASSDATRGRAYSAHAFGGSVGFAAPYAVVAATSALSLSWRVAVGVVAAVGALYTVVSLALFRGVGDEITRPAPEDRETERPTLRSVPGRVAGVCRALVSSRGILGLTVLAFLTSAAAWCIRTYTPELLTAGYGVDGGTANLLVSAMLVVGAGLIIFGGSLTDRVGPPTVVYGGYAALAVIAATLATLSLPLAALALVLPFSGTISLSRPARSTLADRFSARSDLGKNFALVTIGISLGGTVAPPAFGYLIDLSGVAAAFGVVSGIALVSIVVVRLTLRTAPATVTAAAPAGDD
ncbi:Predicted arabinose efflux permease, MFS family [Halopelagius inordinatus]|uniref:Predicted arabinose efflux permease, MFS family n=1 Tax=Halopelagius inordinatus TaxID=553467 RepID=A0A1I2NXE7_9EURY|nr:MFS transporter [Halopelagius inordinatus]SFG08572.1 Predicted arabinose efflux permease, MFS family [Halopelagius inordinatus]